MRNCHLTFSDINPVQRHNLIFGHQVGAKRKFTGEDVEVNTTQKNPNVASTLGRICCTPGAHALVLGAGSGSEVVGLARVGVNVVAIERDAKQFKALTERVTTEAAFPKPALDQLAADDAEVHVLKELAARFTKLNPDVRSHFLEAGSAVAGVGDADEDESSGRADGGAVSKSQCCACGQDIEVKDKQGCSNFNCAVQTMHKSCMHPCTVCKKMFCTQDCVGDHGCVA